MIFWAPIPRVTSHHDFPMNFWEPHFRCTKIYMGNGLVDNSTVPNCPMPNCASRNRSPTSFAKNPEELRPLAWLVFFQCSGGVWCEVMEKLWLLIVKKTHEFWEEVWCIYIYNLIACICPWLPSKKCDTELFWAQLSHCFLWGKKYFGEDNVAARVENHAAADPATGENCWCWWGDFPNGMLEWTYSAIAGYWNSTTFMCFTVSEMEKTPWKTSSRIWELGVVQKARVHGLDWSI